MLGRIVNGRTDLVFDYVAAGNAANSTDPDGTPLIRWCAYYGDVSAIRFLLAGGEKIESLGENLGLNAAAFHGHWRLCEFLRERGADVNFAQANGETALHSALSKTASPEQALVVRVLLAHHADPNRATKPGQQTGAFMRDCRTKGETPLHRAAAFASEEVVQWLLDAGARPEAKDDNGDSPLAWASWYLRPASILRKLCYGHYRISPQYRGMRANLLGEPVE